MADFPTTAKTFTTRNAGDTIQPGHINDLQDEVTAIEQSFLNDGGFTIKLDSITFPAAQSASADAHTLDDYEEGSFTPTIVSSGGGTPTYSAQTGTYVKVGQSVTVQIQITLSSLGTLADGTITIADLPFASQSNAALAIGFFGGLATSVVALVGFVATGTTSITLSRTTAAATAVTSLTKADLDTALNLVLGGTYRASA